MKRYKTLKPAHFNVIYSSDPDPWKFASSAYEREKYAITINALPKLRYKSALEIGCSIGVLTRELASRCDSVLALDAAQAPLAEARLRCADLPTVRFEHMFVPSQWPIGVFDLILFSEVIYYLDERDVARLASKTSQALAPNGDVTLVHWTGATDYPLSGDEAAELFIKFMVPTVEVVRRDRYDSFRLDVLSHRQRAISQARQGAPSILNLPRQVCRCKRAPSKVGTSRLRNAPRAAESCRPYDPSRIVAGNAKFGAPLAGFG